MAAFSGDGWREWMGGGSDVVTLLQVKMKDRALAAAKGTRGPSPRRNQRVRF